MSPPKQTQISQSKRYHNQRSEDRVHHHQLWWSFTVAFALGAAAMMSFRAPKNALIEQDRAPASIKTDSSTTSLTLLSNSK